jgi:hypothetical protein
VITEPVEGSLPYRSMRSQPFERLAERQSLATGVEAASAGKLVEKFHCG